MTTPNATPKLPKALIGPVVMTVPGSCTGLPSLACIYRITCRPLRRHYIGQTTDAARRWLEHQEQLASGTHRNSAMQRAYNALGPKAFTFEVVERLQGRYNEQAYCLAEARWFNLHIEQAKAHGGLFNVRPPGTDNWLKNTRAGRIAGQAVGKQLGRDRNTFR